MKKTKPQFSKRNNTGITMFQIYCKRGRHATERLRGNCKNFFTSFLSPNSDFFLHFFFLSSSHLTVSRSFFNRGPTSTTFDCLNWAFSITHYRDDDVVRDHFLRSAQAALYLSGYNCHFDFGPGQSRHVASVNESATVFHLESC